VAFDPDAFLSKLAVERAKGQPAAVGVPPMLARPEATPNAAGLPDYAHDPVPPHQVDDVRAAIANTIGAEGFDNQHPDDQRKQIIDAVHGVTRKPPGFLESLVHSAGSAVPFGHTTGAALASMPVIGNGRTFRDNFDALEADTAAGEAAHPVAGVLGRTAGGLATVAASGGFGTGAAAGSAAPAVPTVARATVPFAAKTVVGGAQGAAQAASEGADAEDIGKRAVAGATAGAGASTLGPLAGWVSRSVSDLFKGAMARSDERILGYVSEGATKKMRDKIKDVADATVDAIRSSPRFAATYKTPADLHQALGEEISSLGNQTQHFYGEAERLGGKLDPQVVAKALTAAKGAMPFDQQEIAGALDTHIGKFAERTPRKLTQEAQLTAARESLKAGKPIPVIRSELAGNGLSLDEARREVTRLQAIAFDRSDASLTTPAREAAAKAAGILKDALERHVDQYVPGGAAAVRALNEKQTVLLRLEAAAAAKAKSAPTDGGTRLSRVMERGHGVTAKAFGAAKEAGALLSEGVAKAGRAGAADTAATAAALATSPATQGFTQKLAGITNKDAAVSALAHHVFGDAPSSPEDNEPFPEFGPPGEPVAEDGGFPEFGAKP